MTDSVPFVEYGDCLTHPRGRYVGALAAAGPSWLIDDGLPDRDSSSLAQYESRVLGLEEGCALL